ncbi:MAG: hypothetical protein WCH34_11235 [Bacteroidota bacterium]
MMNQLRIPVVLAITFVMVISISCHRKAIPQKTYIDAKTDATLTTTVSADTSQYTFGTVVLGKLDACGYLIKLTNGSTLEPRGLPDEFKKENLKIEFTYQKLEGLKSICMKGPIVKIIKIRLTMQ